MANRHDRSVEHLFDLLGARPHEIPSTQRLSEDTGISSACLRRMFLKDVGVLPSCFLRDMKLGQAYKDLIFTDDPVIEISTRSGFSFQSAFTRAFREQFGTTPSQVRSASVDRARNVARGHRSTAAASLVRMKRATMLRRFYIAATFDAASAQGTRLGPIACSQIGAELAGRGVAFTCYRAVAFVPMRPRYAAIHRIFVEPGEAEKSALIRAFLAHGVSYRPIFDDEWYLCFPIAAGTGTGPDEVAEPLAYWIRNQATYAVGAGDWTEEVTLGAGGEWRSNLYVPLIQKRHFNGAATF